MAHVEVVNNGKNNENSVNNESMFGEVLNLISCVFPKQGRNRTDGNNISCVGGITINAQSV